MYIKPSPYLLDWIGAKLETDPQWLSSHLDALDIYTEERIRSAIAQYINIYAYIHIYTYMYINSHPPCMPWTQ